MQAGIVMIASGSPYYGKMAYNLAMTIKAANGGFPVAVLHNGAGLSHLNERERGLFDHVIDLPEEVGGIEAKLHVAAFTPFDETIYVDADNAWFPEKDPVQFLNIFTDVQVTAITEGLSDPAGGLEDLNPAYTMWADTGEIRRVYKLEGPLYQTRSEVMFMRKSECVEWLFRRAVDIYREPLVPTDPFAGVIPDEFALNIALSEIDWRPHQYKWRPAYWWPMYRDRLDRTAVLRDFWMLSTGGNGSHEPVRRFYDDLVRSAANKLRLQFKYPLQPKRNSLKERYTY